MKKLTKEKQEELDNLSNKYFWEQKATEICLFILIVLGVIAALYISGSIMNILFPSDFIYVPLLVVGILGLAFFAMIVGFIFLLGYLIYDEIKDWIKSNKEEAERKAKKELGFKPDEWGDY